MFDKTKMIENLQGAINRIEVAILFLDEDNEVARLFKYDIASMKEVIRYLERGKDETKSK